MTENEKHNARRKTDLRFFLKLMHRKIRNRCRCAKASTAKYYYGKMYCDESDFIETFIEDPAFLKLHKAWVADGCVYKEIPSVDRIDNNRDYQLDNIRIITHGKNAGKDKDKLPILMYTLEGEFIREWESKWSVHMALKIPNGNLVKVCYGERKSAGGYIWKFKKT